jgi:hypothetical protein
MEAIFVLHDDAELWKKLLAGFLAHAEIMVAHDYRGLRGHPVLGGAIP